MQGDETNGQIIVLTGEGKGKTTAALGMALRAIGHGLKVCMLQLIKGSTIVGELQAAKRLAPDLEITPLGEGFVSVNPESPNQKDVDAARRAWEVCKEKILSDKYALSSSMKSTMPSRMASFRSRRLPRFSTSGPRG